MREHRANRGDLVPAAALKGAPKTVRDKAREVAEAVEMYERYAQEQREARDAVGSADRDDRAAARAAISDGKPAPDSVRPARKAAVEEARRKREAAQAVLDQKVTELEWAVFEVADEWKRPEVEQLDAERERLLKTHAGFANELATFTERARIVAALHRWDPSKDAPVRATGFRQPRDVELEQALRTIEQRISSTADEATAGPSGAEQRAQRRAERDEERRRRAERRAQTRKSRMAVR